MGEQSVLPKLSTRIKICDHKCSLWVVANQWTVSGKTKQAKVEDRVKSESALMYVKHNFNLNRIHTCNWTDLGTEVKVYMQGELRIGTASQSCTGQILLNTSASFDER